MIRLVAFHPVWTGSGDAPTDRGRVDEFNTGSQYHDGGVPFMKLICYTLYDMPPMIRPAPLQRDWMEASPERFAYRCLPLNIANMHGWEVLTPAPFTAIWNGGVSPGDIRIESDAPEHLRPLSHFGSGVLTFHVNCLLRSEPGIDLWAGGPPNRLKDAIQPLTGIIETDWAPYTFTMNWRFTRPNWTVKFAEGEPFCFFFPLRRGFVEAVEPEIRRLADEPELQARYEAWSKSRSGFLSDLKNPGSAARELAWQKAYFRGKYIDGTPGVDDHRTKLIVRPFEPATGPGASAGDTSPRD